MKNLHFLVLTGSLFFVVATTNPAHAAADAVKAQKLIDSNKCSKCHAPTKSKSGPSWKKTADKYRGKTDGEEKIILNITTGPTVKLDDGTEEEHKIIKTKDKAELKNLAQWILEH